MILFKMFPRNYSGDSLAPISQATGRQSKMEMGLVIEDHLKLLCLKASYFLRRYFLRRQFQS